jgi:hypothetical protein
VVSFTFCPLYLWGKVPPLPVPTGYEAGCAPEPVWRTWRTFLALPGLELRPSRSYSPVSRNTECATAAPWRQQQQQQQEQQTEIKLKVTSGREVSDLICDIKRTLERTLLTARQRNRHASLSVKGCRTRENKKQYQERIKCLLIITASSSSGHIANYNIAQ